MILTFQTLFDLMAYDYPYWLVCDYQSLILTALEQEKKREKQARIRKIRGQKKCN